MLLFLKKIDGCFEYINGITFDIVGFVWWSGDLVCLYG